MTGIIIHRSRHAQQYVVIPNAIARNGRLSFRARGLLVMLLSLPPEWHVTTVMLAEDNPESRDSIRAAMRELRESGYVVLHREQGDKGRWISRLEVFDTLVTEDGQSVPGATSENSASPQVAPKTGKPAFGEPVPKKKYKTSAPRHARPRSAEKQQPAQPPPPAELCGRCGLRGHDRSECTA